MLKPGLFMDVVAGVVVIVAGELHENARLVAS
jgi:hypothetical protein